MTLQPTIAAVWLVIVLTATDALAENVRRAASQAKSKFLVLIDEVLREEPARDKPLSKSEQQKRAAVLERESAARSLAWLDDYLAAQNEYAPNEIAAFRRRFAEMSAAELATFLARLDRARWRLARARKSFEQSSRRSLTLRNDLLRRQQAERQRLASRELPAARRQFFSQLGQVGPPTWGNGRHRGYFGRHFDIYGPLITSREVARGVVWSSLFHGRW